MRLLLIDNNDSFTYNIVDILRTFKKWRFDIVNPFDLHVDSPQLYDKVIISPGPGKPSDFTALKIVIANCAKYNKYLLGICLGHQAICEYFGGKLIRLETPVHGQKKTITIDNTSAIFRDMPPKIDVGLYHSWTIEYGSLPCNLKITGATEDNVLMSVEHNNYNIYGVQFHPESFLTKYGKQIIKNFLTV